MKQIRSIFSFAVLTLLLLPLVAEAHFYFTTNVGAITITGYSGSDCTVTIPDSINSLPVVSIGGWAFLSAFCVTNVIIGHNVTNIEDYAFSQCHNLANVTIPNSVSSIGICAFFATGLDSVTIANNVTSIGDYAFECCFSLQYVAIGSGVSLIGTDAFQDCYSLLAFSVHTNNLVYASVAGVLFNQAQTTLIQYTTGAAGNYVIPNSVTIIGEAAFAGSLNLTGVTIPNTIKSVGDGAFSFASSLTNLTVPDSVTNIGFGAFAYCTSLTRITIDTNNSVYSSVDGVLFDKPQTTLIQCPAAKAGSYTVPSGVTRIQSYAFESCGSLASITIPNSVSSIGESAFVICTNLSVVTIGSGVTNIEDDAFYWCGNLTQVYFAGNVPKLGASVFDGDSDMTVYYLPGTLGWGPLFSGLPTALWFLPNPVILNSFSSYNVRTGQLAFTISWAAQNTVIVEACSNLFNPIWLPVGTNTLINGVSSFNDPNWTNYPCRFYRVSSGPGLIIATASTNFTLVTNNGALTIIGYNGVSGVVVIPNMINGLPVTSIADGALSYSSLLTSVTLGTNINSIGNQAFYDCPNLWNVVISDSVTNIGDYAFCSCSRLTSITIPGGVTNIGQDALAGCIRLGTITVDPRNPTYSSVDGVLFDKNQITLIQYPPGKAGNHYTIPNSVTSIGDSAFSSCYSLSGVSLGSNITIIGDDAFEGCSSLANVTIPYSVISIGNQAFSGCSSLASVKLGGAVASIGIQAFEFTELTNITIPAGVTNIGDAAFGYCLSLTDIDVQSNNTIYSSADGVLFDKSYRTLVQYPGGKAGGYTIPNTVTNVGNCAFFACTNLSSVTIPDSVASIGTMAFYYCVNLIDVTIPDGITNIGQDAFYGCFNLTEVYFQGSAPAAGADLFDGDNNVRVYYLPGATNWTDPWQGRPTELWKPVVETSGASFGLQSNRFGFNINWGSGMVVVVEACTNLANPLWSPVATNILTNGSAYFSDPQWTNYAGRFYRLSTP
jgi:hypothetical protein